MKRDSLYVKWGITAVAVACSILVFYDLLFREHSVSGYVDLMWGILSPVIYGLAMAFILSPMVNWFERLAAQPIKKKLSPKWLRGISIAITWLVVLTLLYVFMRILVPELYRSLTKLAGNVDSYYRTIVDWAQGLLDNNPQLANWVEELIARYYQDGVNWLSDNLIPKIQLAVQAVTGGVMGLIVILKDLLVGVIISIYVLGTKEHFGAIGCKLIYGFWNEMWAARIIRGVKTTNRIFSGFVRGKLLDSLIIGVLCFFFSTMFKFPYAPLVSVVIGVTNMIPFFGPFLGAIPSAILILLDSPMKCLYFVIFILALQQFDGNILGPKILGGSTGLPSFWVIVSILVGGGFFGVKGMFLGVPVFACMYAGIRTYSAYRLKKKGLPTATSCYATHEPVWPDGDDPVEK